MEKVKNNFRLRRNKGESVDWVSTDMMFQVLSFSKKMNFSIVFFLFELDYLFVIVVFVW